LNTEAFSKHPFTYQAQIAPLVNPGLLHWKAWFPAPCAQFKHVDDGSFKTAFNESDSASTVNFESRATIARIMHAYVNWLILVPTVRLQSAMALQQWPNEQAEKMRILLVSTAGDDRKNLWMFMAHFLTMDALQQDLFAVLFALSNKDTTPEKYFRTIALKTESAPTSILETYLAKIWPSSNRPPWYSDKPALATVSLAQQPTTYLAIFNEFITRAERNIPQSPLTLAT
jgi:hypothetical protein